MGPPPFLPFRGIPLPTHTHARPLPPPSPLKMYQSRKPLRETTTEGGRREARLCFVAGGWNAVKGVVKNNANKAEIPRLAPFFRPKMLKILAGEGEKLIYAGSGWNPIRLIRSIRDDSRRRDRELGRRGGRGQILEREWRRNFFQKRRSISEIFSFD